MKSDRLAIVDRDLMDYAANQVFIYEIPQTYSDAN